MEEHYIKDVGKITYAYGVNLEEHKIVIEKQQKRIAELEKQLDQANERLKGLPKFKNGDFVWAIFTDDGIYKCQIDAFDYFTNTYLVFPNEDIGNEWIVASYIFKTKKEAEKKLQELRGEECHNN